MCVCVYYVYGFCSFVLLFLALLYQGPFVYERNVIYIYIYICGCGCGCVCVCV